MTPFHSVPSAPRRALAACASAVVLVMPLAPAARAAVARAGQPVMGTVFEVTVVAADDATARRLADAAVAEARHWEDVLTTWRADGELARFNARAGTGPVPVSRDLLAALRRMQELSAATAGAFDPAVAPLVDLWRGPTPPAPSQRARAPIHHIATALTLGDGEAALLSGAALDAGGIGKGLALDAVATRLRAGGAEAAFLDFGGSSQLAIGAPPGAPGGWRVLVAGVDTGRVHGIVLLRDAALATSRASDGPSAAGPIIDPRIGAPVAAPRLATVRAPDATTADAWSTALVVLGRPGLPRLTAAGLEGFYEDAAGTERSAGFVLTSTPPNRPGN